MAFPYHLLIVDDNPVILRLLEQILDEHRVTAQPDGLQATNWLDQGNKPDLIITDLSMPMLDGIKLIEVIRANDQFTHVPIIVLSANDESQTRIQCLELGADDFIIKPFNPLEVKIKINATLRRLQGQGQPQRVSSQL